MPETWLRCGDNDTVTQPGISYNWDTQPMGNAGPEPEEYEMHDDVRRIRPRLAGVAAAGLTSLVMLTTACSSGGSDDPSVARIGSASATPSSSGSAKTSELAYSQCMRAHGIKDFPDPNSSGELHLDAEPGSDLSPDNPQYKAADTACKSHLPHHDGPPAGLKAATLKYAKCMRKHGISDFPDPKSDGTMQIQAEPGSDLDPGNPQYKAANKACKKFLPGGGKGGSLSQAGGGK